MTNKSMERLLQQGECLDVLAEGTQLARGLYELRRFVEGMDYCDAAGEWWIWSIGRELSTGRILAACDTRFYDSPEFECLFLR